MRLIVVALAAWLSSGSARRAALEASLVERASDYARARLAFYEAGGTGGWSEAPEWNPPSEPLTDEDLGAPPDAPLARGAPLAIPAAARRGDAEALRAVGERAFFDYPAQLAPWAAAALVDGAAPERYGLWRDGAHGVGGLRRVALADGTRTVALTCSTCHATRDRAGRLLVGAGGLALDLGRLMRDGTPDLPPDRAALLARWGPGRVDVIAAGPLPLRIPDLRPVRYRSHLQHSATVEQRDLASLATRIDTLLQSAHGGAVRAPREVAAGLALYLWSLADALPPLPARGRAAFDRACGGCHRGPGLTGPPVEADVVGGDLSVARSRERGTGKMSVPSLRGLADRGALLHDGSIPDLATLLDPARTVGGHRFGAALSPAERAAVIDLLSR